MQQLLKVNIRVIKDSKLYTVQKKALLQGLGLEIRDGALNNNPLWRQHNLKNTWESQKKNT